MHPFSNCFDGKSLVVRSVQTIVIPAAALLSLIVANIASADEVIRWNQIATDASTTPNTDPLTETRIFAILHVAIHDAVNAAESRYEPYLPRTSPVPGASVEAAIAAAAHDLPVARSRRSFLLTSKPVKFQLTLNQAFELFSTFVLQIDRIIEPELA